MASLPTSAGLSDSFNESISRTCLADRREKTDSGDCDAPANTNKSFAETEVLFPAKLETPPGARNISPPKVLSLGSQLSETAANGVTTPRIEAPLRLGVVATAPPDCGGHRSVTWLGATSRREARLERPFNIGWATRGFHRRPRVPEFNGSLAGSLGNPRVSGGRGPRGGRGCGEGSAFAAVAPRRVAAAPVSVRGGDLRVGAGPWEFSSLLGEAAREAAGRATVCLEDCAAVGSRRASGRGSTSGPNRTNGEIAWANSTCE